MENTVEMMTTQVQDDVALTAQEPQTLADVIGGTTPEQPVEETNAPAEQPPQSEPGWMKKRVGAAVNKAVAEAEARIRAEYESQLAPLREMQLEAEADKLMAEGVVTKREIALELVRARKGMPPQTAPAPTNTPARDEQGRFVASKPSEAQQRAQTLMAQADIIKRTAGVDVMALYNTDPEIKQKVLSGEWDFVNVYESSKQPQRRSPAPVRGSNSIGLGTVDVRNMTDAQLDKLNEMLEKGGSVDMRM